MYKILCYIIIILYGSFDNVISQKISVELGADRIVSDQFYVIENKRIGIVTNHSAVLSNGIHLVDTLFNLSNCEIVALFGPEHGIRGNAPDGKSIKDGIDPKTNIPVYSLYGKTYKPSPDMLKNIDILIFDIQDIGARFYTFISTLYYTLIASAENNIPIVVLDRPNPIGGNVVDGPIRKENFKSFVAIAPIPIQHGMTIGELANMFNSENWLGDNLSADLTIIEMDGWYREFLFDYYELTWINPSPNIPSLNSAILYPGMCLIEGVNVSEGRGTYSPFLIFGAPYINSEELLIELKSYDIPGLEFNSTSFKPIAIENMSIHPKYQDQTCSGINISVRDKTITRSLRFGIQVLYSIKKLYPRDFEYRKNWLDKLFGDTYLREMLDEGKTPSEIFKVWESELYQFKKLRSKYLLY